MAVADIGIQRLATQGLARPAFATAAEVVRWMGAVQAQDFLGSLWAIGCRMERATEGDIERAITERAIVRTWPMRGTVHFVPAEDARWMVDLLAPRVIARLQGVYRQAGLDEEVFARSRDLFVRALEGGRWRMRGDLYALLEDAGIATANYRGLHIVGRLAQEGLICFGPREGKQPTFTLLDEWAPDARTLVREEALAEVALRYFRGHGPATLRDFVWWAGLLVTEARAGLEAVRSRLVEETIDGQTYWWADGTPCAPAPPPALRLLPPFDEYLVSYNDRGASLDPRINGVWARGDALSSPIIVIDGRVVGAWKRTFKPGAVAIEATLARTLDDAERVAFDAAARRYGEFVGLPAIRAGMRSLAPDT